MSACEACKPPPFNPHHVSVTLSARLVELGADSIFVDCEHGSWSSEDVRVAAQVIRGAGDAAIVRPDSHQRSVLIRYLNAGADGLMVPMVDTADQPVPLSMRSAMAAQPITKSGWSSRWSKRWMRSATSTNSARSKGSTFSSSVPATYRKIWGYPPAPPFGQPRPQAVMDKVGFAVDRIRAAGKVAGTLVTADELPHWREKGVQFFYIHSDPFLRLGLNVIKKSLGR